MIIYKENIYIALDYEAMKSDIKVLASGKGSKPYHILTEDITRQKSSLERERMGI